MPNKKVSLTYVEDDVTNCAIELMKTFDLTAFEALKISLENQKNYLFKKAFCTEFGLSDMLDDLGIKIKDGLSEISIAMEQISNSIDEYSNSH